MSSLQKNCQQNSQKTSLNNNDKINGKPLIYACSGCSNLGQMAHNISLTLDGDGIGELSCIAGVAGEIGPIMAQATSGRTIIVIDGCELACTKACLDKSHIKVDYHFKISDLGFDKRDKWDDSLIENSIAMRKIYTDLINAGIGFTQ